MNEQVKRIARKTAERIWSHPYNPDQPGCLYATEQVELAIEEALTSVPVPPPVSEERLAQIWAEVADSDFEPGNKAANRYRDLKAQLGFLSRLLQDLSADGAVAQYEAGFRACLEQQQEALKDATAEAFKAGQLDVSNRF